MNFKFDNKLVKYLVIIVIIYLLVSKMPLQSLPGKNPFILTAIVILMIYLLDQPNVLFENYTDPTSSPQVNNFTSTNSMQAPVQSSMPSSAPSMPPTMPNISPEIVKAVVSETISQMTNTNNNPIVEALKQNQIKATPVQNFVPDLSLLSPPSIPNLPKQLVKDIDKDKDNSLPKDVAPSEKSLSGLPSTNSIITSTISANKAESCNCEEIADKAITKFLKNRRMLDKNGMLHYADDYFGDMGYSQLRLDNYISMGSGGDGVYNSWDLSDYSVLNTNRWKPSQVNTAHCKTDVMPQPQPIDSKIPLNLMNWDYSRKVMPRDSINIDYINDKLNN